MKRRDLTRHLLHHDCVLIREGSEHSVYANRATGAMSTVPRHREIKRFTAKAICEQLGIPTP